MKHIVYLLLLSSLVACKKETTYTTPLTLFENSVPLQADTTIFMGIDLINPFKIVSVDTFLIIHDRFNIDGIQYHLALVGKSGKYVKYFGRDGRGPDEYLFPVEVSRVGHSKSKIAINNRNLFQVSIVDLNNIIDASCNNESQLFGQFDLSYSRIYYLNETKFVGTGFFEEGRFAVSDTSANKQFVFGRYPFEAETKASQKALGMAYQSNLVVHPNASLFASATPSAATLDIIRVDQDSNNLVKSIHSYPVLFTDESTPSVLSIDYDINNEFGYLSIDGNDQSLFLLFSGKTRTETNPRFGKHLLEFNWDGTPLTHYLLDREISKATVDHTRTAIYGTAMTENEQIILVRYGLPK